MSQPHCANLLSDTDVAAATVANATATAAAVRKIKKDTHSRCELNLARRHVFHALMLLPIE